MSAFAPPLFLPRPHPLNALKPLKTPQTPQRLPSTLPKASISTPDDELPVRFDRDPSPTEPKRSFFPTSTKNTIPTPNDRVLTQVMDTMRKLGVSETDAPAPPPSFTPIDISRVNPLSAFLGSAGAAGISYTAWMGLGFIVAFFVAHPLTDEIYVVQRISAVVRTALVCLFALGSGISGVTALGLFMLGLRTGAAAITGEFSNKNNNKSG